MELGIVQLHELMTATQCSLPCNISFRELDIRFEHRMEASNPELFSSKYSWLGLTCIAKFQIIMSLDVPRLLTKNRISSVIKRLASLRESPGYWESHHRLPKPAPIFKPPHTSPTMKFQIFVLFAIAALTACVFAAPAAEPAGSCGCANSCTVACKPGGICNCPAWCGEFPPEAPSTPSLQTQRQN